MLEVLREAEAGAPQQMPTSDEGVSWDGVCFYYAVDKVSTATRGRSDLTRLVDWIDGMDQLLFNQLRAIVDRIEGKVNSLLSRFQALVSENNSFFMRATDQTRANGQPCRP